MKRLEILRKNKRLTQACIAEKLGVSRQAYARYEKGEREPDFFTLNKIADIFNVSIDYLLGRENDPLFVSCVSQKSDIQKIYDLLPKMEQGQVLGFAKGLLEGIERFKKQG